MFSRRIYQNEPYHYAIQHKMLGMNFLQDVYLQLFKKTELLHLDGTFVSRALEHRG